MSFEQHPAAIRTPVLLAFAFTALISCGAGVAIGVVIADHDDQATNSEDNSTHGQVITLDNAEVGQCTNIDVDDDSVMLSKKDCSDDHDGEIVYVGTFDEVENSGFMPSNPDDVTDAGVAYGVCSALLGESEATEIDEALDGKAEFGIANEDSSPSSDEKFLCYVKRSDDEKIDEKIS